MNNEQVFMNYLSEDADIKNLVDWQNPPSVRDLKKDLSEALPSHNQHVDKVNGWISALRGELKIKVQEGRSKVQPKLVRKQNEWRYSALEFRSRIGFRGLEYGYSCRCRGTTSTTLTAWRGA